jgi:hypothetical protein
MIKIILMPLPEQVSSAEIVLPDNTIVTHSEYGYEYLDARKNATVFYPWHQIKKITTFHGIKDVSNG